MSDEDKKDTEDRRNANSERRVQVFPRRLREKPVSEEHRSNERRKGDRRSHVRVQDPPQKEDL